MGDRRRERAHGGDLVGSTISQRSSMQDKSMRSSRGTAQAEAISKANRGAPPRADERVPGYKYASRDTLFNRLLRPGKASPTVYIEKVGGRAGGRGKRV